MRAVHCVMGQHEDEVEEELEGCDLLLLPEHRGSIRGLRVLAWVAIATGRWQCADGRPERGDRLLDRGCRVAAAEGSCR